MTIIKRRQSVCQIQAYLPKTFVDSVKEHTKRLRISFTQYLFLSLYRSLFEGLHETDRSRSGDVLLNEEVRKVLDGVSDKTGIRRNSLVNYLLKKALEGKDKRMDLDSLIDEMTREGIEDGV